MARMVKPNFTKSPTCKIFLSIKGLPQFFKKLSQSTCLDNHFGTNLIKIRQQIRRL